MRFFVFILVVYLELFSSCALPKQGINIFITSEKLTSVVSQDYLSRVRSKIDDIGFKEVYNKDESKLNVHFEFIGYEGFTGTGDSLATYIIKNTENSETIKLEKRMDIELSFSFVDDGGLEKGKQQFTYAVAKQIKDAIYYQHCEKFQSIFDKQIAIEQEQNKIQAKKTAEERVKEDKRRQALAKLSQEQDYQKLKKVLSIKPEYRALLDERTKTMLIGSYSLGEMSKAINSGANENRIIQELEGSNLTYASYFTPEQKTYLREAGLSNKLIEYLELHTQEVEIKRERERRLARLERQREREEEEAEEERREAIESARRSREQQERNDASRQRWIDASNIVESTRKETLASLKQQAYEQQRYNQNSYDDSSYSSKSNTREYRSDVREVNNRYEDQLAQIRANKIRVASQREEPTQTRAIASNQNKKVEEKPYKYEFIEAMAYIIRHEKNQYSDVRYSGIGPYGVITSYSTEEEALSTAGCSNFSNVGQSYNYNEYRGKVYYCNKPLDSSFYSTDIDGSYGIGPGLTSGRKRWICKDSIFSDKPGDCKEI